MDDAVRQALDLSAPAGFEALLSALMGVDNTQRGAAEAVFERCKAFPEALVAQLVRCLRLCDRRELRELSAVLLRKVRRGCAAFVLVCTARWQRGAHARPAAAPPRAGADQGRNVAVEQPASADAGARARRSAFPPAWRLRAGARPRRRHRWA